MDCKWMNKTLLALSIQMVFGLAYAAEEPQLGEYETTTEQAEVSDTAASTAEQVLKQIVRLSLQMVHKQHHLLCNSKRATQPKRRI